MQTIHTHERTNPSGTLSLTIPLNQPDTEFEVVVVLQARASANGSSAAPVADPWAAINAFRQRLAASGRVFTDSAELIREDRDRGELPQRTSAPLAAACWPTE
jgi:hypothetical protein